MDRPDDDDLHMFEEFLEAIKEVLQGDSSLEAFCL
ncbi:hypothetical protein Goklo_021657 [Gossypium klotzschianum]|uniref:Uncharacterized protein n=1 Tax=Gossypium klotzschianum TaxID=34286 RepID=A0A7J8UW06_9ROSI|nr:hypothetical protein [Gossypium klotzschianum]